MNLSDASSVGVKRSSSSTSADESPATSAGSSSSQQAAATEVGSPSKTLKLSIPLSSPAVASSISMERSNSSGHRRVSSSLSEEECEIIEKYSHVDEYEDDVSNYIIHPTRLQSGGYGVVHMATRKKDGLRVALKFFGYTECDPVADAIDKEILLMYMCKNIEGIVKIYSSVTDTQAGCLPNRKYPKPCRVICMELLGKDLFDGVLALASKGIIKSQDCLVKIFRRYITCLKNLHDNNMIHRDLKCENIMLMTDSVDSDIRIIDFGALVILDGHSDTYKDFHCVGTPEYLAPETRRRCIYSRKTDIFQSGIVLFFLLFTRNLNSSYKELLGRVYHDCNNVEVKDARDLYLLSPEEYFLCILPFNNKQFCEKWNRLPKIAHDLLYRMLARDPAKRLTADEVLAHPFLNPEATQPVSRESSRSLQENPNMEEIKKFVIYQKLKREFELRRGEKGAEVSPKDIAAYYFRKFDLNNDGKMVVSELREGIFDLLNEAVLRQQRIEDSMDGAEYPTSAASNQSTSTAAVQKRLYQVDEIFHCIDSNQSGWIDCQEFEKFVCDLLEN